MLHTPLRPRQYPDYPPSAIVASLTNILLIIPSFSIILSSSTNRSLKSLVADGPYSVVLDFCISTVHLLLGATWRDSPIRLLGVSIPANSTVGCGRRECASPQRVVLNEMLFRSEIVVKSDE